MVFRKFKELADKKKEVFDDDLNALVEEQTRQKRKALEMVSVKVVTGTEIIPNATVKVKYKGRIYEVNSTGDGPVDACYKAIDKVIGRHAKLLTYKLDAITRGKDAQGMVSIEIKYGNRTTSGKGSSTDILEASTKAYIDALNRVI